MTDFRTYTERKQGWWVETRSTIPCILPKDGLLAVFLLKDVEQLMDSKYPVAVFNGQKVWFFNSTRDREIAEQDGDRVYANPQVLTTHYLRRDTA